MTILDEFMVAYAESRGMAPDAKAAPKGAAPLKPTGKATNSKSHFTAKTVKVRGKQNAMQKNGSEDTN